MCPCELSTAEDREAGEVLKSVDGSTLPKGILTPHRTSAVV
jgi:hypothetical protein